ncbi:MAG: TIGR03960 family B12-binding radical SAM protein [Firmicutes bacterium]|nr:TIGR03960 family B12-binding radical SAM protein [Bacillota bacterium]
MNLNSLLKSVNKPARYVGGEYNTPNLDKVNALNFCLCFPDIYEVGMSNLGFKILYHLLNEKIDIVCQRCFAPFLDMGKALEEYALPLFSLEKRRPLNAFDVLGFSLQYELSYTTILYMLHLSNIPFYSLDRDDTFPLVIAGGPSAFNPEPVADFFDLLIIGEAEEKLLEFLDFYKSAKAKNLKKKEILKEAATIGGIYVPSIVAPKYKDGKIQSFSGKVNKCVIKNLDKVYYPTAMLVPNIEIVHDRSILELFRGCYRSCRFCQAGYTGRPIRYKSADTLFEIAKKLTKNTGYDEISLNSLSTGDYPYLKDLIDKMQKCEDTKHLKMQLPSLRADSYFSELSSFSRKSSLTFAPEAGSQRLRNIINKNITKEDIENCLKSAFRQGFFNIKLYFMIGLPDETEEDIHGILDIVKNTKEYYNLYRTSNKQLSVSITISTFVPKPFTPFEWERFNEEEEINKKLEILKSGLKQRNVYFSYNDYYTSKLEVIFSRGDRKLSRVIETAFKLGCRFDGSVETFKKELWKKAFLECKIDDKEYLEQKSEDEILPWDFINIFVDKEFLILERQKAKSGIVGDCKESCLSCGASQIARCKN